MGGAAALPGGDTFVLAFPFLAVLAMAMFGLDERAATPKQSSRARRSFCGVDGSGRALLSDPDGKPWLKVPIRQIEGQLVSSRGAAK